jgi:hypothetical protein
MLTRVARKMLAQAKTGTLPLNEAPAAAGIALTRAYHKNVSGRDHET